MPRVNWAALGAIIAALKLALDIILNWERIKKIWASFRAGSIGRFEAAKRVVYVVAERALRPILIIGAIVWLAVWLQGNLIIQPLHPISNWTLRQYALAIALVVPLALLVYILLVEPWRRSRELNSKVEIPKPYPQVFLSNPKCDRFRETASDPWRPAVVYAEPWRENWQKVARDLIICGAKWIWIRDRVTDDEAKKGCRAFHKRDFEVYEEFSPKTSRAEIVLCIDDEAIISVNQKQLGTYIHWDQKIDLTPHLKRGTNTLAMELSNHAHPQDTPKLNPTGVIYKLTIDY